MENSNECKKNFVAVYDGSNAIEDLKVIHCITSYLLLCPCSLPRVTLQYTFRSEVLLLLLQDLSFFAVHAPF